MFNLLVPRVALAVLAITLSACGTTQVRPPSGSIGGLPVNNSKVVLRADQDVRAAVNVSYLLPAGDYRPVMESDTGIYFQSPGKVFMRENFVGIQLPNKPFDGGIYLDRASPQAAHIFIITPANQGGEIQRMLHGGRPAKPFLPRQPIAFELKRS